MYGFIILSEISKDTFEISHKILNPYTTKYAFYEVLKIWRHMISWSYDILSLSETGPSTSFISVATWGQQQHPTDTRWPWPLMPHKVICDIPLTQDNLDLCCHARLTAQTPWNQADLDLYHHSTSTAACPLIQDGHDLWHYTRLIAISGLILGLRLANETL